METISAREIDRYIFDRNYLLVDVRQPADYRRMHVRGAVYLSVTGTVDFPGHLLVCEKVFEIKRRII